MKLSLIMPTTSARLAFLPLSIDALRQQEIDKNGIELVVVTEDAEIEAACGVLVPPEDPAALAEAIIRLVQDRASQQQMGEAGQRYVMANYTWEKSLDLMATLYEKVLHAARQ